MENIDKQIEKNISKMERLIVALDLPTIQEAKSLVETLADSVVFYKIGLELFCADGFFDLLNWLKKRNKKVFADLKLFDVPRTVGAAVKNLALTGADFVTVHGNDAMIASAVTEKGNLKILAVTALTSLDQGDLQDLGFTVDAQTLVLSRAKRALALGCDGVVSSGLEVAKLRQFVGKQLIAVVPGIRPIENRPADDQKRVVDVTQAFQFGADYIVMGRPIYENSNPYNKALEVQKEIGNIFVH